MEKCPSQRFAKMIEDDLRHFMTFIRLKKTCDTVNLVVASHG